MFSKNAPKWATLVVIAVSAVVTLTIASGGDIAASEDTMKEGIAVEPETITNGEVRAASNCKKVNGKVSLQPVTGPACTSPIGICGTGLFTGDLKANSEFTGTSLTSTVDTPTTGVVVLTADNVFHTDTGDLITKPALVLSTTGAGDVAVVDTVMGGTGGWAGATGFIKAIGTLDPTAGGEGAYIGEICTP
jgi:hypothetical protein